MPTITDYNFASTYFVNADVTALIGSVKYASSSMSGSSSLSPIAAIRVVRIECQMSGGSSLTADAALLATVLVSAHMSAASSMLASCRAVFQTSVRLNSASTLGIVATVKRAPRWGPVDGAWKSWDWVVETQTAWFEDTNKRTTWSKDDPPVDIGS